ncbi:hypothetical protein [Candidatus Odyssella thessalonicensis]|uniref:hypothetical protein n=1 Tax=Candidatus Odyssella thessalonicensis TaxID=84647 RepID=UPI000225B4C9|nr:hypothetical protein [Candidatus Odyssella thessalonicensis]
MARKKILSIFAATATFLLSGISEGNAAIFKCFHRQDSSTEVRNPVFGMFTPQEDIQGNKYGYQSLDDGISSLRFEAPEQPEGQFRSWYRHALECKNHVTRVAIQGNKHSYQPLVDKDIYASQRKSEHGFRNWVYKLAQGKYAKKLDLLAGSEYDLSTAELWGSNESTLTSGRSEFTDIPHDPNKLIDSSYNAVPVSPDYPRFLKFVRQGNSEIVSKKEMGLKALMDCPVQSEE